MKKTGIAFISFLILSSTQAKVLVGRTLNVSSSVLMGKNINNDKDYEEHSNGSKSEDNHKNNKSVGTSEEDRAKELSSDPLEDAGRMMPTDEQE